MDHLVDTFHKKCMLKIVKMMVQKHHLVAGTGNLSLLVIYSSTVLTVPSKHLFSLIAPQQPRKPTTNRSDPTAIMMYAALKISGLSLMSCLNESAPTTTQIPIPNNAAPPS